MIMKNIRKLSFVFVCVVIVGIISFLQIKWTFQESKASLTLNMASDTIKEEIFSYVIKFDKVILKSLQVENNAQMSLSMEQRMDIIIKYIIENLSEFQNEVIQLEDGCTLEKDGSLYHSIGYIDKEVLLRVSEELFPGKEMDYKTSIYYDKEKDLICLFCIYGDAVRFDEREIVDFLKENNQYIILVKYSSHFGTSFIIKYDITENNSHTFCIEKITTL